MVYAPLNKLITVTRLNGKSFTLNAIYIEQLESFPDTTITLTNGNKFIVKESESEIKDKVLDFYKNISVLGVHKNLEE